MAWPKGKARTNKTDAVIGKPEGLVTLKGGPVILGDPELPPIPEGDIWAVTRFFPSDFACQCGNFCMTSVPIKPELLIRLEHIAANIPFPLHIREGVRCDQQYIKVMETPGGEAHLTTDGYFWGVDISCSDQTRHLLLQWALKLFPRVGVNETFIHVDLKENTEKLCWVYGLDER